ncbi:MAG: hypothetical protein LPK19_12850 [Hymenobacteraceae bacterium]|nr:hypothetical protein [Hymenobacteraceae bacterium]MDX5397110.1 hypothetical protein [Hymenobacteraceae bacterium]MDX5513188.1 hypothetical protein [Hymenobacteraceae bacterium]
MYEGKDNYSFIHFNEKQNWQKQEMEVYSFNHELVYKENYQKLLPAEPVAEIKLMSEALQNGDYIISTDAPVKT